MSEETSRAGGKVILFANGKSGSNKAQKYLRLETESLTFREGGAVQEVLIFDLCDSASRERGINTLNASLEESARVRAVVAGGDGSLIWLIESCVAFDVEISRVDFGILPFGTGNDLSASLGWGRFPQSPILGKCLDGFRSYLSKWLKAKAEPLDIWELEIVTSGYFEQIKKSSSGFEREKMLNPDGSPMTVYKRLMTNYFSIGVDARIGVGFDKHRTKRKACNKLVYCWEGLKKMCCKKKTRVAKFADQLTDDGNPIFRHGELPDDVAVLLALNTRSYGGGDNFVWDKSNKIFRKKEYQKSNIRDGLIEFLLFRGDFGLAFEQVPCAGGNAFKLHQGGGPFEIRMREEEEGDRKIYMQVDGEYFYAIRPQVIRLSLSSISAHRQVNVLVNKS